MRIPLKSGDEYDALTRGGRKYVRLNHGQRTRIKRGYRRRLRRALNALQAEKTVPTSGM